MVWRLFAGVLIFVVAALGAFYAWAQRSEIPPVSQPSPSSFDTAVVAKGAQLAAIGDCAECHTQAGGKPFAGGFPVQTPFGTIYGTNITPDAETGIGSWSEAAFRRAMREGVDRKGKHLYPAFPYDHFAHTSDADISALYAFLMTRTPVRQENRAPDLPFPLNIRLSAAAWELMFLNSGRYHDDPTQSADWNRGAYLVRGLGHCGACHTPRNALGAEKQELAYAGATAEGWWAPALNHSSAAPVPWTADEIFAHLRWGFADQHGIAAGPMQSIVHDLRKVSNADRRAIATYISSLMASKNASRRIEKKQAALRFVQQRNPTVLVQAQGGATTGVGATPEARHESDKGSNGALLFAGTCATCHHSGGDLPISRPVALGLSSPVNAPGPDNFIRILLGGIHPMHRDERGAIMPGFSGALTDAQIIELTAYVRSQFSQEKPWHDIDATLRSVRRNPEPKTGAP